ncbi:type I-E CRISPR-associated protein Cse1/CasA [Candidatus Poriferisocius sp.]|uniref:type I-E CRISPR-associated protein Cse1/CasA n=1 Tax=Candidatus Poriferisocius sp. TaxID=3101276 RepID=UPI003B01A530
MNTGGFNLIHDPWIPIGDRQISIREALIDAHNLPGWPGGDFGLAEAVLRLLIPIAYRLTDADQSVTDEDFAAHQASALDTARFHEEAVDRYLDRHADRFWLVGGPEDCHPFGQDKTLESVSPHEAAKAVTVWASGNNAVLGPHFATDVLPEGLAAQRLLVLRHYAWGGLHTKHPVWTKQGKFVGSPLRGTMSVHPVARTFAETLIGHLVPLLGGQTDFGLPFWEQPPPSTTVMPHAKRAGLLEQIAGRQDKTMLLRTEEGKITGFTIAEGPGVDRSLFCEDPYLLYGPDGEPRKPKASKAFWRESEALVAKNKDGKNEARAHILEWATGENGGTIYPPGRFSWAVVSHLGDKSKDLIWDRHLVPDLLSVFEPAAALRAREFIHLADEAEKRLTSQIAKLWHQTGQMPAKPEHRFYVYSPARSELWRLAETDFWQVVAGTENTGQQAIKDRLRGYALQGYDRATEHLSHAPRTLLDVIESRKWLELWERASSPPTGEEAA